MPGGEIVFYCDSTRNDVMRRLKALGHSPGSFGKKPELWAKLQAVLVNLGSASCSRGGSQLASEPESKTRQHLSSMCKKTETVAARAGTSPARALCRGSNE